MRAQSIASPLLLPALLFASACRDADRKPITARPIDPFTGNFGAPIHVDDPYNLYFTPDGRYAIVVAERRERLDFRAPRTMRLVQSVHTDCRGIDHMEFTADGRYMIATCE